MAEKIKTVRVMLFDETDEAERQNARKGIRKVMNLALQGGGPS